MSALLLVLLMAPTADAQKKEKELTADAKKEVKKLEGKWKAVKLIEDGEEIPAKIGQEDIVIEFNGRKMTLNGGDFLEITAADPSTDPKCIDFKALVDRAAVTKGTAYEGIYKIDGETLLLALYKDGGAKRPDKFESTKDSKYTVVTFERVKK